jgi:phage-related protein
MADVKIEIPGIGEVIAKNVASESTLRELLKSMSGGGGGGAQNDPTPPILKAFGKNTKEASEEVGFFGSALKGVSGIINGLGSVLGGMVGVATNLSNELLLGGSQLSDFTRHLPIGPLQGVITAVEGQIDSFRNLSDTGATFGNNMFELQRIAGQAAIPIGDMTELLKTNGLAMRTFGGTVGSGARSFAGLAKEFRQSTVGRDLMAMGFTTQDLNENLLSYSEIMQQTGNRSRMSNSQLLAGTAAYTKQLDAVAKLTGKSRKALEEEMRQKNSDIRIQMAQRDMTAEAATQFTANLARAGVHSQTFEQALLDMSDGLEHEEVTAHLGSMSDTFRRDAKNISKMSADEYTAFVTQVRKEGLEYADAMGKEAVQQTIKSGSALGEAFKTIGELGKVADGTPGKVEAEQNARDKATTAMTTLAESINEIRGAIVDDLLGSQIFKDLSDGLGDMIPSLETVKETYNKLKALFDTHVQPSIDEFVKYLKGDGMKDLSALITNLQDLSEKYLPKIKDFFSRLLDDPGTTFKEEILPALKDGLVATLKGLFNTEFGLTLAGLLILKLFTGMNPFGIVANLLIAGVISFIGWDNIKSFFISAFESITDLSFSDMVDGAWTYIKDWFGGLWKGLKDLVFDVGGMVTGAWTKIKNWFGSLWDKLFDFEIKMPNFKQYLPKWMGGEGKSLFGSDDDTVSSSTVSSSSVETEPTAVASVDPSDAFSGMTTQLSMLNTKLDKLITKTTANTTAVKALNGNIQAG